jgi:cbb3-type cytochrome oxidase subunit 3
MGAHLDLGSVRGAIAIALFVVFIAMWLWTYSPRRRAEFASLERLPLEEDHPRAGSGGS